MNLRDLFLKEFRGQTIGTITDQSSVEEMFQNEVLRPILKLQNDLLIATFKEYIKKNKIDFIGFTTDKKMIIIENSVQKDIKFRNTLKGMIIGLFTSEEYYLYSNTESYLNKRIISMLIERLKSQIQLIEL
jgi:hypothetical protein